MTRSRAAFTILTTLFAAATTASSGVTLHLDSFQSGASPAHRLTFDVSAGNPEIVRAELTYPVGFRFLGFLRSPAGDPCPKLSKEERGIA